MDAPSSPKQTAAQPSIRPALNVAAQSASTSYKEDLPPAVLRNAILTGITPTNFKPHIGTLLEGAPLSMLNKVVEQIQAEDAVPADQVWSNIRAIARDLKVIRDEWIGEGKKPEIG